ncbi:dihydroorotate dehydrogenase (quinone) [Actinophytocola xinjiangensis]|uniref:Dihydroorotate dehydrogenase (quinone) n=1 Tax=Actinophytocola xinjiangensis TaxID=485602 RepID=A0A7Z1AUD5_9PSEU|nr:quinone-dependent dihydroorotate dehydrogenase [Actinophytocola xinjiangensis]OLF05461.1 dihydroorotate dehydrogenase (quinone) [Actinophytocola xinjiangensis]
MVYQHVLRRALFRFGGEPEVAHERTLAALGRVGALTRVARPFYGRGRPVEVFGVRFPGRVGLAAGVDKNGVALRAWPGLGFGFVEVGTVTAVAQPGNPRPRLYRLPASEAVINRMGFNNEGAAALAERLRRLGRSPVPIGVSIGKSKVTPVEDAVDDYRASLRVLFPYADYFAINVSSPNTPGLRGLQDRDVLAGLLASLRTEADELAAASDRRPPLLVKIAPDLTLDAVDEVLTVCADHGVAGLIATNTTLSRDGLAAGDRTTGEQPGGLSGRPLTARALEVVTHVTTQTNGRLPVIGVGGLHTPDDAARMFDAGASLVQLYTGFIYRGPALVRRINRLDR